MKSVVGLYSTPAEAKKVKSALEAEGYEAAHVTVIDQSGDGGSGTTSGESFTDKVKGFFGGFSDHEETHGDYVRSIGNGGALLALTVAG